jgi:hypothetical protein
MDISVKTAGKKNFVWLVAWYILDFWGSLNKEEFIETLESILYQTEYGQLLEKLFDKVFTKKKFYLIDEILFFIDLAQFQRDRTH